jgi:hypothetical protein
LPPISIGGKNKRMVALLFHLFGIECHAVAGNLPRVGKNKRSVALKFATLAKGGTELSHGGKKNVGWHCYATNVARICHVLAKINVAWHCYATR